jgi:outer membrane protein OmpA-like peptidoglycan-associated protein
MESSGLHRWIWPLLALLAVILAFAFWPRQATFNVEDQVRLASRKAMSALAALRPGFAPQELVSALDLEIINFQTGSAQLPDYGTTFLNRAAEVIKMAPAGAIIEIAGHTDNTGDAASNLALSQQRADASATTSSSKECPPAN